MIKFGNKSKWKLYNRDFDKNGYLMVRDFGTKFMYIIGKPEIWKELHAIDKAIASQISHETIHLVLNSLGLFSESDK
ncbi:MAG: hypothetical protein ACRDFC_04140, partial [Ignavibacteria bacterium]